MAEAGATAVDAKEEESQAREIIRLRDLDGLSFRQIAERMPISRNTIRERYKKFKEVFTAEALAEMTAGRDPSKALAKLGEKGARELAMTLEDALQAVGLGAIYWARGVKELCEANDPKGAPNYKARESGLKMLGQARRFLSGGDTPPEPPKPQPDVLVLKADEADMFRRFVPGGHVPRFFRPVEVIDVSQESAGAGEKNGQESTESASTKE